MKTFCVLIEASLNAFVKSDNEYAPTDGSWRHHSADRSPRSLINMDNMCVCVIRQVFNDARSLTKPITKRTPARLRHPVCCSSYISVNYIHVVVVANKSCLLHDGFPEHTRMLAHAWLRTVERIASAAYQWCTMHCGCHWISTLNWKVTVFAINDNTLIHILSLICSAQKKIPRNLSYSASLTIKEPEQYFATSLCMVKHLFSFLWWHGGLTWIDTDQ